MHWSARHVSGDAWWTAAFMLLSCCSLSLSLSCACCAGGAGGSARVRCGGHSSRGAAPDRTAAQRQHCHAGAVPQRCCAGTQSRGSCLHLQSVRRLAECNCVLGLVAERLSCCTACHSGPAVSCAVVVVIQQHTLFLILLHITISVYSASVLIAVLQPFCGACMTVALSVAQVCARTPHSEHSRRGGLASTAAECRIHISWPLDARKCGGLC